MAKITLEGLVKDKAALDAAGVELPKFDVGKVKEYTREHPVWVHMGPGNIFRGFIASLAQSLLNQGVLKSGIQTLSSFDGAAAEEVCRSHDYLTMEVTLMPDRTTSLRVIGSVARGYEVNGTVPADEAEVVAIFQNPELQMMTFTITEKGYAIKGIDGTYIEQVKQDIVNGPDNCRHAMSITAALLHKRYQAGALPIAVVSMDNCSHNGDTLRDAVLTIAGAWLEKGFVDGGFIAYLRDKKKVSFPCTMIDKITPRPAPEIAQQLKAIGIEDMDPIKTDKGSFIAPFVNAEKPQYLVIEDEFPAGRPQFEKAGVLFTDKAGVNLCERMKVTTCLNPLQTALAVFGCILGYTRISDEMENPVLVKLVNDLGYKEGLPVVDDPKILSPRDFISEVIDQRLPNKSLPDTPQRIVTDTSQKMAVRFGETLKNYRKKGIDTSKLIALPLSVAGWLRYLLAVNDEGKPFELSDDPLMPELKAALTGIELGNPQSVGDKLKAILSNSSIFGLDLYDAGIGPKVEELFIEMIKGPGAVRETITRHLEG